MIKIREFTIIDFSSLVSTTDNCDNSPTLIQSPPVGSLVSSDTVISFLSTDESDDAGNSNCEFTLLVHLVIIALLTGSTVSSDTTIQLASNFMSPDSALQIKMIFTIQIVSLP